MTASSPVEISVDSLYPLAKKAYASLGVDTDDVLRILATLPVSVQCWQGDDVRGLENPTAAISGGIMATGTYPGAARTGEELFVAEFVG